VLETDRWNVGVLVVLTSIVAALLLADLVLACTWLMSPVVGIPGGAVAAVWGSVPFLTLFLWGLLRGTRGARRVVRRNSAIVDAASEAVLLAGAHDVDSRPETTWIVPGHRDTELRLDDHEITVRTGRQTRWITWDDVRWFRDSQHFHLSRRLRDDGWELAIVLKDGSVVCPGATRSRARDSKEAIAAVRLAARHHASRRCSPAGL
jgi:hypothetical protein